MSKYRVMENSGVDVMSAPSASALVVGHFMKGQVFDGDHPKDSPFIKVVDPIPPGTEGFVFIFSVREENPQLVPLPIREEQHEIFCQQVTRAARAHGPERNYLMAAAYCLSDNLRNVGSATSKKVGPFQIAAEDWKKAIGGVAKDMGFSEADRFLWYRQPAVAALIAGDCAKRLAEVLGKDPTFTELYFMQLVGDDAPAILKGDRSRNCSEAMPQGALPDSYAGELKAGTKRVDEALEALEKKLIDALAEAYKVINRMPPDIRYFRPEELAAPWMAIALAEYEARVEEDPDPAKDHPHIVAYHKAAGLTAGDNTAWCASFVAYCMKESGVPAVADSVPAQPAWAPNWEKWGNDVKAGEEPIGTVITWQPGSVATGHVGFLVGREANGFIELLGGNQGPIPPGQRDTINIKKFPARHITSRRWFGPLPGAAAAAGAKPPVGVGLFLSDGPLLVSVDQFRAIFPDCPDPALWAAAVSTAWRHFGITTRQARAGFLGITGSETRYTGAMREKMNYTAEQAAGLWPQKASDGNGKPNKLCKDKVKAGPEAFANWIYGDIELNRGEGSGDGWRFRGGGIIQLTGRRNYTAFSEAIQLPELLDNTDLILDPAVSATAAGWYVKQANMISALDTADEEAFLNLADAKVGKADNAGRGRRRHFLREALRFLPI